MSELPEKVAPPCATDAYVASLALEAMTNPMGAVLDTVTLLSSGSYAAHQRPALLDLLNTWWKSCSVGSHMMWVAEKLNPAFSNRILHSRAVLQCLLRGTHCYLDGVPVPLLPDAWKTELHRIAYTFSDEIEENGLVYAYSLAGVHRLLSGLCEQKPLGQYKPAKRLLADLYSAWFGGLTTLTELLQDMERKDSDLALVGANAMRGLYPQFYIEATVHHAETAPWV